MPPIQLRPVRGSAPRGYDPHLVEPSGQENVPQRVLADPDERRWPVLWTTLFVAIMSVALWSEVILVVRWML